jgi:hypothetical protein
MEQQTNITQVEPVELDNETQRRIVNFVLDADKKGREERAKYEDDWKECVRWYNCEQSPDQSTEMQDFPRLILPWAYDAVESAYSYLHSAMIPRNDRIFNMEGRTEDDHPGIDLMEKYSEQVLERANLADKFGQALKQLLLKNHTCIKTYWRNDVQVSYEWGPEGTTQSVNPVYNGVYFDVVDVDNFSFYPICGDINKTTRIHTTYRFLEELKEAVESGDAPYFNVEKLSQGDANEELPDDANRLKDNDKKETPGVKLREAWIHRIKVGDKVYKNYIATVAGDSTLIRFQPNPYPDGSSPFLWIPYERDGVNANLGFGFLSRALNILGAANELFNARITEERLKIHKPHVYWDDNEFNPYNMIMRPGAMIRMAQDSVTQGNLRPLMDDLSHLALTFQEVAEMKAEFESVTIPKVVKGVIETQDNTATEARLAQGNATGKLHTRGFYINENLLKPMIELVYRLLFNKIQVEQDPQVRVDLARCTMESTMTVQDPQTGQPHEIQVSPEELANQIPPVLPLPEIDVQVIGYQNSVRKEETLMALGQIIPQMVNSPMAGYLKWDNAAEVIFENANLDKDRLLKNAEERAAVDQQQQAMQEQQIQAQQQQLMLQGQLEIQKQQLEEFKAQAKAENDIQNTRLKELEIELKYGLLADQQGHQQAMEVKNGPKDSNSNGDKGKKADSKSE